MSNYIDTDGVICPHCNKAIVDGMDENEEGVKTMQIIYILLILLYMYLANRIDRLKIHWGLKWIMYMFSLYAGMTILVKFLPM